MLLKTFRVGKPCVRLREVTLAAKILRERRVLELRALCNDSPRTPPGPEGSNGNGSVSCAAEHPKFLSSRRTASATEQNQDNLERQMQIPHFVRDDGQAVADDAKLGVREKR